MGGIASRLAVFTSAIALVATATVGYMVYRGAERSLMEAASERVAHTAETAKVRTWTTLSGINDDVLFLAETPPVQGIVRARMRRGLDPLFSIYDEEWGEQLANIFKPFLESRASYRYARFVELHNDGRELVRVNRTDGKVAFANVAELERSIDDEFMREAARRPRQTTAFSDLQWIRSSSDPTRRITVIDIATPVYSQDGQSFGVIVVGVDVSQILASLKSTVDSNQTLYVANARGELLHVSGVGEDDVSHADPDRLLTMFPAARRLVTGYPSEVRILDARLGPKSHGIAFFEAATLDGNDGTPRILIGVSEPHETILSGVRAVRNESAVITLLLCIVAIVVALVSSSYLTKPIRQITRAVASFGGNGEKVSLPIDRKDEIGVLARSFAEMERQIQDQFRELEAERRSLQELSSTLEMRVRDRTADLEHLNLELQASNRELREIADVASHDLQEPLRKLQSFADLLESEYADVLDEDGRMYTHRIFSLAQRMSRLMTDVLAFSRATSRPKPLIRIDLRAVARDVASRLEDAVKADGGKLCIEEMCDVEADPAQMHELFEHLIDNAVRYGREGVPPVVHVRAKVIVRPGGREFCEIEVQDNGAGFDERYLDRIFAPFERLHGRLAAEGTGMGLTICRRIVENHRGTITARSRPGKGSTFVVRLPLRQTV